MDTHLAASSLSGQPCTS